MLSRNIEIGIQRYVIGEELILSDDLCGFLSEAQLPEKLVRTWPPQRTVPTFVARDQIEKFIEK